MTHWALVLFLFGGYGFNSPAVGSVSGFDSQARCEAAAAQIKSRNWYCVQTDGPNAPVPLGRTAP